MSINLEYSNTNNATYQVPLFFISTNKGPYNTITFIKNDMEFVNTYGNKPIMLEESFVYAYRTSMLTPIYCCNLAPLDYTNPNLIYVIANYNNQLYILPGYIGKNTLFYPYPSLTNSFNSTSLYEVLWSASSFFGGEDYQAKLLLRDNYLYFVTDKNADVIPFINESIYTDNYAMDAYSFTYSNTNIKVVYDLSASKVVSYTYIDQDIFFDILYNILSSNTLQMFTNSTLFIESNTINEQEFLNALQSISNVNDYFIKYVIAPIQTDFSNSMISSINKILYNFCINQHTNYLGSLLYTYIRNENDIINSNLIVSYTHLQKIYYTELGKLKISPIHYDAVYKIINYRLRTKDNSTTVLLFNDIYHHSIDNYTNEYSIKINKSGFNSFTIYTINQIVNTYKGPAQTTFRTTYKGNNVLVYEYVNADLLDLLHRLYRVLLPLKHKLYYNKDYIKQLVSNVISEYHLSMIDKFTVYIKDYVEEFNTIAIVIRIKYKRIAETVDITLQI